MIRMENESGKGSFLRAWKLPPILRSFSKPFGVSDVAWHFEYSTQLGKTCKKNISWPTARSTVRPST